jgi:hypothetical protein
MKPIGTAGSSAAPSGGAAAAAGSSAAPSGGAAGSTAAPSSGGTMTDIPCDAFKALQNSCHRCHGEVPANGAPMSLVKTADFQVLTVQTPKIPKYQQARERIDGTKNPRMPPPGSPITDADKQTLIDWLGKGAPAAEGGAASCP